MKKTLSIQGGMAIGKTTLLKSLEPLLTSSYISYENPQPIVKKRTEQFLDLHTKEGFIANQRLFIEAEIKRYNLLPKQNIIFDRGPEDTLFYTLYYPIANGYDWGIENALKEELHALRNCLSDYVLYFNASIETLRERKALDTTRKRNSFEKNLKLYPYEQQWYKQFNATIIDVDDLSKEDVQNLTMNFLKSINFI